MPNVVGSRVAKRNAPWWYRVEMPTENVTVPEWCLGARVEWYEGFSNWPELKIRGARDLGSWPGKTWMSEGGGFYRARSPDGLMDQLFHDGRLTWVESRQAFVSSKQEGFAGREWPIKMADGSTVILCGPWSTLRPSGWTDFSYADGEYSRERGRTPGPWERELHFAGLAMSEDLFLRIVAKFLPHLRCARVDRFGDGRTHMEVYKDGEFPKGMTVQNEALFGCVAA